MIPLDIQLAGGQRILTKLRKKKLKKLKINIRELQSRRFYGTYYLTVDKITEENT